MIKALWLVISPIAFFANVPITSGSAFCQASGFFLTVSIEASDIAVLLIAIHTALFILRPRSSSGAAGLYPFRRIAYACWAIIPVVLGAIVPLTGGKFVSNGPHCYLPLHPFWYRSALSWIPRYIIFAIIIVTYVCLYIYVALQLRRFGRDQRRASAAYSDHPSQRRRKNHRRDDSSDILSTSTPPLAEYNHLDSERDSLAKDDDRRGRRHSVSSGNTALDSGVVTAMPSRPPTQTRRSSVRWNTVDFSQFRPTEPGAGQDGLNGFVSLKSSVRGPEATIPIQAPEPVYYSSISPRNSQQLGRSRSSRSRSHRKRSMSVSARNIPSPVCTMLGAFRCGPPRPEGGSQSDSSNSVNLEDDTEETMRRLRDKQLRQLRLLLVYPAVYMLTWIAPFASHIVRYSKAYADGNELSLALPSLALQIISIGSLSIGAAVDCCFFSAWEKPWLHLRGGFWEGLASRLRIRRPMRHRRRGVGRTRDEMFLDARTARSRREQEENLENLSNDAAAAIRRRSQGIPEPNLTVREGWDVLDVDCSSHESSTADSSPTSTEPEPDLEGRNSASTTK